MENGFKIESVSAADRTLTIVCSGSYEYAMIFLVGESIKRWMGDHPTEKVEELVLDLTAVVDYVGGDPPVSSIIQFGRRGVRRFRLIANPQNRKSLENLVRGLGMDKFGFSVEGKPGE